MSYALETKKRKFHRVLESLTKPLNAESLKPASAAVANISAEHAPSVKRARLGDKDDRNLGSVRRKILKAVRPTSRDSSASTSTLSRPSFVPWDRERFLERLETFRRVDRWSPKPEAISEVEWAKRGWICTDVSRVTCVGGCGGSVVVKVPDELDELDGYDGEKIQERKEVRSKLVEEYSNLIIKGHGEQCPWKNKGCDATIHRIPLSNPDTATSGLKTRYSNLIKMAHQLPAKEDIQLPESFSLEDTATLLPNESLDVMPPETTEAQTPQSTEENHSVAPQTLINEVALILAFFGWDSVSDEAATGLVSCGACFRRLGLWMYKPKQNGDSAVVDPLDVVHEHMEYCPWINGKAQSGMGKTHEKQDGLLNGWELIAQALKVKHRRQIRSSVPGGSRACSEAPSTDGPEVDGITEDAKKAKDREWWAKIRRMREVLNVKSPKRTPSTT